MENEPAVELPQQVKPPHVREITVRSAIAALLVAALIGASYPYVVLKFGFGPNISVVSAFFGFLMLGLVSRSYNRWENNIVQTAGTAAGQIAFMCWLVAAFEILASQDKSFDVQLTPLQVFLWFSIAGLLGVFLAVPLRRHFIVDEKLPFPDGIAAAETLTALDSRGPAARRPAFAMVAALVASMSEKLLMSFEKLREGIDFAFVPFGARTHVGIDFGILAIGSGMIIGLRVCASMFLGMLIGWVIGPQWLLAHGYIDEGTTRTGILLLVMWPATGALVAGGLTALALKWRTLAASFRSLSGGSVDKSDFPMRWVIAGSILCAIALVIVQFVIIGTPWWQSVLAILLSLPLMVVAMRVLGETNWGPISTMTNVMQGMFGAIAPGNLKASMVSSGITGSVAAESEGLMQDYKTGHIIGSTPRLLTYVQLAAVPVGALALAFVYPLIRDKYGIIGPDAKLSSPTSLRWVGFAQWLKQIGDAGDGGLDPALARRVEWMQVSFVIGACVGIALTLLENVKSIRTWVPSVTGAGIGMLVPANAVTTMFIGALIGTAWRWLSRSTSDRYQIPVASGFIAGEALIAVIIPVMDKFGWL